MDTFDDRALRIAAYRNREKDHIAAGCSIFQSNNDPEMRFRFQYKMILKLEWA
jgi:hypothetical protein